MKTIIAATILSLGIAFSALTATATTLTGLNTDFVNDATVNSDLTWFFNFSGFLNTDHHVPIDVDNGTGTDPVTRSGKDYTPANEGGLGYTDPRRKDNTLAVVGLTVTGFAGFASTPAADLAKTAVQEQVRQDYVSSGNPHNGIGVMSDAEESIGDPPKDLSNSLEQVNFGRGEYLRLLFDTNVNLAGFDFSNGSHGLCGSTNAGCGGFELLFNDGSGIVQRSGSLFDDDFRLFTALTGSDFLLRATSGSGTGELGWYLSGIAGNAAAIPLPAALPLYGTGLAVMGFLGWRRKRRAVA